MSNESIECFLREIVTDDLNRRYPGTISEIRLIAKERDRYREALEEITHADMSSRGFQRVALDALDALL